MEYDFIVPSFRLPTLAAEATLWTVRMRGQSRERLFDAVPNASSVVPLERRVVDLKAASYYRLVAYPDR
jgi:hypothetical protein